MLEPLFLDSKAEHSELKKSVSMCKKHRYDYFGGLFVD